MRGRRRTRRCCCVRLRCRSRASQGRRNARFDPEATSVATSRLEIDTHLGFGRGSAVREYWLMRCQGFSVMRADGRRLGRVKRVETHMEGTFLRLRGLRARTVHFSAVDTVWPDASLLVISDEHVHDGSRSEEHTSELQSRENVVCRLLL